MLASLLVENPCNVSIHFVLDYCFDHLSSFFWHHFSDLTFVGVSFSQPRDSLLASLLDGVRASGNRDVCVKMTSTQKGQRWGLLSMPVDEEVESLHLRFLATPPSKLKLITLFYNALLTIQMLSQMLHT